MRHLRSSSANVVDVAPTAEAFGADSIDAWTFRKARTRWRVRFWNFPLMQVGCWSSGDFKTSSEATGSEFVVWLEGSFEGGVRSSDWIVCWFTPVR